MSCFKQVFINGCLLLVMFGVGAWILKEESFSTQVVKKEKPNIVLVITDDQGYGDVGFNGCRDIPTPNIDRIARNGVVFTHGYVSYSVCAPSRAGLMTGRYQDRFGYSRNPLYRPFDDNIGLPLSEQTLPEYLKQSGYATMAVGKWHLGVHEKFRPQNRGFDAFYGFLGGGHRYFPAEYDISNPDSAKNEAQSYRTKLVRNNTIVEEKDYLTDILSREAVNFIQQQKDNPFFLYLAYNAPHTPLQAPAKYLDRFPAINDQKRKTYAAMVSAVDDGVGLVLDKLEELKLSENTIIIFLSDNGGPENDNASDNGPLRGGKGSVWEGGIRVPFVIQWPGQIKPGTRYTEPVISLDIFATIAAALKEGTATRNPLDGTDLLPYLQGTRKGSPHTSLYWRQYDPKNYAVVHSSGFKQILLRDSAALSFNLHHDDEESQNLSAGKKESLEEARNGFRAWEAGMVAPIFYGLNQEQLYEKEKIKRPGAQ